jgi:drug/metabolite transporter (DMT)-like permease
MTEVAAKPWFNNGIGAAVGAAVLFGVSTPLAKGLLSHLSPLLLAGTMYLGSGLGLAAVLAIRAGTKRRDPIPWPRGSAVWWLLTTILSGGILGPYLLLYGLQTTDSASASLILNLEGVFTALLAWFVFRENFDRRIALGMSLIVAGGALLALGPTVRAHGLIGPLAIGGACLAWSIDNNLTRKVSVHDAAFIACAKGLVAGASAMALALAAGAGMPNPKVILQAGSLGFVTYGLSLTLFVMALRSLGTARTAAYFSLAPFIGAVLALSLGAPFTPALLWAGLLMAAGVWLHLSEHHSHWHRHEPLTHEHAHVHDAHHRHDHGPEWDGKEPHSHAHHHEPLEHSHAHYPDIHHRHGH